jgi:hypothetical protein
MGNVVALELELCHGRIEQTGLGARKHEVRY